MKTLFKYFFVTLFSISMFGCTLHEPLDENLLGEDRVNYDPAFAEGILLKAYDGMVSQLSFNDAATDDAVSNYMSNYRKMAIGEWNAQNAYTSRWGQYSKVLYINKFISAIDNVAWKRDVEYNEIFKKKMYGEALAMRALWHFWIFQEHAGPDATGELMGVPYITQFLEYDDDFNIPRLSFAATIAAIEKDFDEALKYLPMDYDGDISKRPAIYDGYDADKYAIIFGESQDGRISGRIIKAFKAKLALFAASPAFLNGADNYYQDAATILGGLLSDIGGVSGLDPEGCYDFYDFEQDNEVFPEVLWRSALSTYLKWVEEDNYPPSLNGNGKVNPTQDLVDAFPMLDGYPIKNNPAYDKENNPYASRDPRLARYILYNGNDLKGRKIYVGAEGGIDAVDKVPNSSTRSGFYLKKLLDPDVVISTDGTVSATQKIRVYLRYTDLFLMLAEAANEIGGPDYKVSGMSARDIIGAIRHRAGVGLTNGDAYLTAISNQADMRELIRNERRIELCFEGHRLYDLRRWNMLDKISGVKGVRVEESKYDESDLEPRIYSEYANYSPIPYDEIVKFDALKQNKGW